MIGNATAAFEQNMHNLFANDITPLVNKVNAMALAELGSSAPASSQDCGTPVDCYQQAIQKLNEARQEIQNKADKTELSEARQEIQTDLSTVKGEVESLKNADVETTNCRDLTTQWDDPGNDAYKLQTTLVFLDRHNVKCGDNEQLTRWQLQTKGHTWGSDPLQVQVHYTCCQGKIKAQGLGKAIIV